MSRPLLILVPRIGAPSEMFIASHVNKLAPTANTSVIAREVLPNVFWSAEPRVVDLSSRALIPYQSRRYRLAKRWLPKRIATAPPRADPATTAAISAALDAEPETAILAEYLDAWSGTLLELSLGDRPVVVRSHGYDVSVRLQHRGWVERYRRLAERVTIATCSEYSRDLLIHAGIPGDRIVTVANGVDPAMFGCVRQQRKTGETFRVLSVGRLVPKKDPRPTIAAIAQLRARGIDATLTIAGEGSMRRCIEDCVSAHGLATNVQLLGAVPHSQVIELLGSADAFVQHSVTASGGDEEGMPMSVLEAMASSLVVVGTRHAGIPEAIGDAGHVIEPQDIDSLASLLRTVAENPAEAREMGDRARQRIAEHLSWHGERARLRELLDLS